MSERATQTKPKSNNQIEEFFVKQQKQIDEIQIIDDEILKNKEDIFVLSTQPQITVIKKHVIKQYANTLEKFLNDEIDGEELDCIMEEKSDEFILSYHYKNKKRYRPLKLNGIEHLNLFAYYYKLRTKLKTIQTIESPETSMCESSNLLFHTGLEYSLEKWYNARSLFERLENPDPEKPDPQHSIKLNQAKKAYYDASKNLKNAKYGPVFVCFIEISNVDDNVFKIRDSHHIIHEYYNWVRNFPNDTETSKLKRIIVQNFSRELFL